MTLFPNLIAGSLRLTHIPLETGLFVWQVASIFLFLLAVWHLSGALFSSQRARWGATVLLAGLLTLPISGTGLYLIDQYVNPRNLAGFAAVFAITYLLKRKYLWAFVWVALAASVHPLMWVFPFSFCALWIALGWMETRTPTLAAKGAARMEHPACFGLVLIPFTQYSPAYHEAAKLHAHHYIQNWAWYEWVGIVAPIVLMWWFGRIAQSRQWTLLMRACRAFAIYGLIYLVTALVLDLPARFESLARLQPMRSLYLEYIFLFVCVGGLLGEFVLKHHVWRWLVLFVPMAAGMFLAQRALFPASAQVEWPGAAPKNPWAQAFVWIRANTPVDAVFAMDPGYMHIDGEDNLGFRCMAERSRMADAIKDNGVVSMFPPLADEWWSEVQAQTPWKKFHAADFVRLKQKYGVGWVVLQRPGVSDMDCPYQNASVMVCRVP